MKSKEIIENIFENYKQNELIFASKVYKDNLSNSFNETTYYKILERMCKKKKLSKIAKGIYYIPAMSKYGAVPPSEKEIINAVTENNSGLVIGYKMYNDLKLTTQISKNVEVLSSTIDSHTKNISNVKIKYVNIDYTEDVKNIICGLEVLQNFNKIQDINYSAFIDYSKLLAKFYKDEVFETVISKTTYKKSTIAFFKNILNYYKISNNLDDYLSSLSIYKHPKMEELYEIARISN